jgi:ABC-2 type transport system permease protein
MGGLLIMFCAFMAFGVMMLDTTEVPFEKTSMNGLNFPIFLLSQLTDFLVIVLIVLIGGLLADDYRDGTLKQTLIKPIRRSDLIIGKVSVIAISTVCYLTIILLTGYVAGFLAFGWGTESEGFLKTLLAYGLTALPVISFLLIVLVYSLIITNGGMAIGAGIGTLLVFQIISGLSERFGKYIINHYFQIGAFYLNGFEGGGILASLLIPIVYILIFSVVLINLFNKKDIVY